MWLNLKLQGFDFLLRIRGYETPLLSDEEFMPCSVDLLLIGGDLFTLDLWDASLLSSLDVMILSQACKLALHDGFKVNPLRFTAMNEMLSFEFGPEPCLQEGEDPAPIWSGNCGWQPILAKIWINIPDPTMDMTHGAIYSGNQICLALSEENIHYLFRYLQYINGEYTGNEFSMDWYRQKGIFLESLLEVSSPYELFSEYEMPAGTPQEYHPAVPVYHNLDMTAMLSLHKQFRRLWNGNN